MALLSVKNSSKVICMKVTDVVYIIYILYCSQILHIFTGDIMEGSAQPDASDSMG